MHYGCTMTGIEESPAQVTSGRREQLLAAAREVLALKGYERTTVSSIAGRAKVAQGTFYLYFPSKEALPGALAEQLSEALGAAAARATADARSLDDAVDALVEATWRAAEDHKDVLVIANRGIELAKDWQEFLDITAPWREPLEDFLRRFQAAGEIEPSLDPMTTACVLRDILDRSMKAKVCFGQDHYAQATSLLVRRALAA
jgi:AcrR family transcriptional regulator